MRDALQSVGFCTPGLVMNGYSFWENISDLIRELVEQNFDGNLTRCTDCRPILRMVVLWQAHHCSYAVGHGRHIQDLCISGPNLNASIGNQETDDQVREERALFHERYNCNVVNHRSQEVLLLHFGATVFYEISCLRGLQTFFQLRSGLRQLSSTLPEQSNSEDVSLSMPGRACQDVGVVICD